MLGQNQRAQHAGAARELRGDHVGINALEDRRHADVAVEQTEEFFANHWEEQFLLHDAAAEENALRRQSADPGGKSHGEIAGFEFPGGMIGRKLWRRSSPASLDGGARSEAFETILVVGATAGERILVRIMRNANMSHLGVEQSVDDLAVHYGSAADSGSYGEIEEVGNATARTPAGFACGRRIDVGIKANGNVERALQGARQVTLLPVGLRG